MQRFRLEARHVMSGAITVDSTVSEDDYLELRQSLRGLYSPMLLSKANALERVRAVDPSRLTQTVLMRLSRCRIMWGGSGRMRPCWPMPNRTALRLSGWMQPRHTLYRGPQGHLTSYQPPSQTGKKKRGAVNAPPR